MIIKGVLSAMLLIAAFAVASTRGQPSIDSFPLLQPSEETQSILLRSLPKLLRLFERLRTNFPEQLSASEACDPEAFTYDVPQECRSKIATFAAITDPMTVFNELPSMCSACGNNTEPVMAYIRDVRAAYDPANEDRTCAGARMDMVSSDGSLDPIDRTFMVMEILMSAACSHNEGSVRNRRHCFDSLQPVRDIALGLINERTRIVENVHNITGFNVRIPEPLEYILSLVDSAAPSDVVPVCTSLREFGCCTGTLLNAAFGIMELGCLHIPTINTSNDLMKYICPGLETPSRCATDAYTLPPNEDFACNGEGRVSRLENILQQLDKLIPVEETRYNDCKTSGCPVNDCELLFCAPGGATDGPEINNDFVSDDRIAWNNNRVLG